MFIKPTSFSKYMRFVAMKLFNYIENNNNCDFLKNGEKYFIKNLFEYLIKKNNKNIITLFDIGANIGDYAQMLIDNCHENKLNAKIHIFEPTQSCFAQLEKRFSDDNIILNRKAISNQNGISKIFYDQQQSGLASLHKRNLMAYSIEMNKSEVINTIRLDEYIKSAKIEHIHFMKIDIEGHGLTALKGIGTFLNPNFINFIQFEYGGANLDSHSSLMELYDCFIRHGFRVAKIMPKGLEIRFYQPWMDNFQYANYVAISEKVMDKLK